MKDEKGVALILALMVTAILVIVVLEFAQDARIDMEISRNYNDQLQSYAIARSGVEFAKYALKQDDPENDNLKEDWAQDYSKIVSSVMFKRGNLKLNIVDESSKIQVNTVIMIHPGKPEKRYDTTVNTLKRLCEITHQDYKFVDALIDWVDSDDVVTIFEGQQESGGAENDEYQKMVPPYKCKNAPLDTVRELFMVKWFDNETYFGTKKKGNEDDSIEKIGLKDFLTIYGSYQININTAPREVIMALDLDIDDTLVENIIKARTENPFKTTDDVKKVPGMTEQLFSRISKKIMFRSAGFFSVHSIGIVNNIITEINAVLYRASKTDISIVYWQVL